MSVVNSQQLQSSYQGLHSERMDSLEQYSQRLCSNLSGDHSQLSMECPIHHPIQQILLALRLALRQRNYKGVEVLEGAMLVVRMGWLDRLAKVFFCRDPPKYLIRFDTREYASTRILTMKSLASDPDIREMKAIMKHVEKALPQPPTAQEQEYKQDIYSLDATSTYMFHKILLNDKYSIGKKMALLLRNTSKHYQKAKLVTIPPPIQLVSSMGQKRMDWAHSAMKEISDDMLQGFNCSRKELVEILAFCRKTVEEYYYFTLLQEQANNVENLNYNQLSEQQENRVSRQTIPLTEKQFCKLKYCFSSAAILRQIFLIHHTYQLESELLSLNKEEKRDAMKELEPIFADVIAEKVKVLESSQYREEYRQYAEEFMS